MAEETYKGDGQLFPVCVGTYDRGHAECDGDPNGSDEQERMPCQVRDQCVGMAVHLRKTGARRDSLIQLVIGRDKERHAVGLDEASLQKMMADNIKKYRIKDGIAVGAPGVTARGVRPATPAKRPAAGAAASRPSPKPAGGGARGRPGVVNVEGRRLVEEIGVHYQSMVLSMLGRSLADSHGEAQPGQLFIIDRRDRSGYVSLYCKGEDGRKIAVTSMYFKPNNGALEIRVAADYRLFTALLSAPNSKRLEPSDYTGRDGQFKVRFPKVDRMGAGIVAEALDRAAKAGILDLPAMAP